MPRSQADATGIKTKLSKTGLTCWYPVRGTAVQNRASGFEAIPLRNYSAQDVAAAKPVTAANMVTIESITVINADPATAASLSPKANTAITNPANNGSSGSSGGAAGLWSLLGLALLGWRRQRG